MASLHCLWSSAFMITIITTAIHAQDPEYFIVNPNSYDIREGASGGELTVQVSRDGTGTGSVRLRMTLSNTANQATAEDYATSDIQIDFFGTDTTKSATIDITDDNIYEGDGEVFTMTLTVITGSVGTVRDDVAQITILDNDSEFYVDRSNSDTSVSEDIGTADFVIKRRGYLPNAATVEFNTLQDSTARAGQDYTGINGRVLSFGQNADTQTTEVTILNDMEEETTERFSVYLSDPTNGQLGEPDDADVEILNDDGVYSFSQATYVVSESASSIQVCVMRTTENTIEQREVLLTTATTGSNTASPNGDYTPLTSVTGRLVFGFGDNSECLDITILGDSIVEPSETFAVQITELQGEVGVVSSATVTITDDDATFAFQTSTAQVAENAGAVSVAIERRGYLQTTGSVRVTSTSGSATSPDDFGSVNQLISFTTSIGGVSTQTLTISIVVDDLYEGDHVFYLDLVSPSGGQIEEPDRMTITILDDDDRPPVTIFPRDNDGFDLTDGQIAGIAVAAAIGALALIGIALCLCCLLGCPCCPWLLAGRRRDRKQPLVINQQPAVIPQLQVQQPAVIPQFQVLQPFPFSQQLQPQFGVLDVPAIDYNQYNGVF